MKSTDYTFLAPQVRAHMLMLLAFACCGTPALVGSRSPPVGRSLPPKRMLERLPGSVTGFVGSLSFSLSPGCCPSFCSLLHFSSPPVLLCSLVVSSFVYFLPFPSSESFLYGCWGFCTSRFGPCLAIVIGCIATSQDQSVYRVCARLSCY